MHQNLPVLLLPTEPTERAEGMTLIGMLRLKTQAWLTRHAAAATLVILEARQQVALAGTTSEEAEAELFLRREVRASGHQERQALLGQEAEVERLLLERERLRSQRQRAPLGGSDVLPLALPAAVEWDLDDRQIETMAVKAVTRFSALPPPEAERAWAAWHRELRLRLPPYAAAEVARRAEALRGLAR
jgi:hypothetical protein